jgi:HSP20 family protein
MLSEETMNYMLTRGLPALEMAGPRQLNRWFEDAFGSWPAGNAGWLPPVDILEDANAVRLVAELPGLTAEDVKLTLENQTLTLRGEKRQVAEETTERVHRYERSYGTFERSFRLPGTVETDKVDARFENGVLTITLPKAEKAKARDIEVKVR